MLSILTHLGKELAVLVVFTRRVFVNAGKAQSRYGPTRASLTFRS